MENKKFLGSKTSIRECIVYRALLLLKDIKRSYELLLGYGFYFTKNILWEPSLGVFKQFKSMFNALIFSYILGDLVLDQALSNNLSKKVNIRKKYAEKESKESYSFFAKELKESDRERRNKWQ